MYVIAKRYEIMLFTEDLVGTYYHYVLDNQDQEYGIFLNSLASSVAILVTMVKRRGADMV